MVAALLAREDRLTSNWLKKVAVVFKPTAVLRNAQPKQVRTTSPLTNVLTIALADVDQGPLLILRPV